MSNRLSPRDAERPMARCANCNGHHPVRAIDGAWELKDHESFTWEGGSKPCNGSERTVTAEAILAWAEGEREKVRDAIAAEEKKCRDAVAGLRKQIDAIDARVKDVK